MLNKYYWTELIMPESVNVEKDVESILLPYMEGQKDGFDSFVVSYEIGGKFNGAKFGNQPQGPQYNILNVSEIVNHLRVAQLLVASHHESLETRLLKHVWNGCIFQKTAWSGNVLEGINIHNNLVMDKYHQDSSHKYIVRDHWIAVTIDMRR